MQFPYTFSAQSWQDIVSHMARNRIVEAIVRNIVEKKRPNDNYASDLCQDIYVSLLDKPKAKQRMLKEIYCKGDMNFYITRIVLTQVKSKNSETWRRYRKQTQKNFLTESDYEQQPHLFEELLMSVYEHPDDNIIDKFPGTVQDLMLSALTATTTDWYNIELTKKHLIEGQTLSSISKQTQIPLSSVFKTISTVKSKMRTWIEQYIEANIQI